MNLSRRAFFQSMLPKSKSDRNIAQRSFDIQLGHLSIFPVNTETQIRIEERDLLVKSLPEGIQLVDVFSEKHLRLSLDLQGYIIARMNEFWPSNAVLSIFSGEIYFL